MLVGKDTFLISVDKAVVGDVGIVGLNGKPIIIDTDYNKYSHSMRVGRIAACPVAVSAKYQRDGNLKDGDTVVFHHFVCQPDHKIAENLYRAEYFHVYGKIENGKLDPIEEMIFVTPIMEEDEDVVVSRFIVKTKKDYKKQVGIVHSVSPLAISKGIFPGDKVFFTKDADYKMEIEGMLLYRMRIRNIVAVERDGKLISIADRLLVKEIPVKTRFADAKVQSQRRGVVVAVGSALEGIAEGVEIAYYNGVGGVFDRDGDVYSFIELRNINYMIDNMKAQPVLNRVIIEQDPAEESIGGFTIADTEREKPKRGTVVAVGPGSIENGIRLPMQSKVGDKVLYGQFAGANVSIDGKDYVIVREDEILTIL